MWFWFRQITPLEDDPERMPRLLENSGAPQGVGRFGLQIFLASLTFIFGATLLLYVILMRTQEAPVIGVLEFVRGGVILSTILLIASSWTLRTATRAITKHDNRPELAKWLVATLYLGYAFVASQSWVWFRLWRAGVAMDATNRHAALFVVLTVLHALHVVGGIVRLHQVTARAKLGQYSRASSEPVTNAALYWHYLDVVWLVMLAAILALSS